jgi:hypothetical protein
MCPETKGLTLEEIDSHFGKINVHGVEEATPQGMLKGGLAQDGEGEVEMVEGGRHEVKNEG